MPGLAAAPVWGLVRSAQAEHPGRLALADLDPGTAAGGSGSGPELAAVLGAVLGGESEVAVRGGQVLTRRLAPPPPADLLQVPAEGPWRLEAGPGGTPGDLVLAVFPAAAAPLGAGQVRVAVRAAGLGYRDVAVLRPGVVLGAEGAGVVTETGPQVTGLVPGDRVMGLLPDGFGPVAVTDWRLLARVPAGWSFAQAASVPAAFLAAYRALTVLARARRGRRCWCTPRPEGPGWRRCGWPGTWAWRCSAPPAPASGACWPPRGWTGRIPLLPAVRTSRIVPGRDRRHRRRHRAQRAAGPAGRGVAAAAAARRDLHRAGHGRLRRGRRACPGVAYHALDPAQVIRPRSGLPRSGRLGRAAAGGAGGVVRGGGAGAAAGAGLGRVMVKRLAERFG